MEEEEKKKKFCFKNDYDEMLFCRVDIELNENDR